MLPRAKLSRLPLSIIPISARFTTSLSRRAAIHRFGLAKLSRPDARLEESRPALRDGVTRRHRVNAPTLSIGPEQLTSPGVAMGTVVNSQSLRSERQGVRVPTWTASSAEYYTVGPSVRRMWNDSVAKQLQQNGRDTDRKKCNQPDIYPIWVVHHLYLLSYITNSFTVKGQHGRACR